MGGPLAYLALQISTSLKRIATIYGLMALWGLVTTFAAGYALDAVRTQLMFHYGAVLASLIVAGGLIVVAGCLVGTAIVIKNRAPAGRKTASPARSLPYPKSYSPASLAAAAAAAAGGLAAAVIIARSRAVRAFMARHPKP